MVFFCVFWGVFLRLRTNVAILYGTYFFVGLYNSTFDISAKTLEIVYVAKVFQLYDIHYGYHSEWDVIYIYYQ